MLDTFPQLVDPSCIMTVRKTFFSVRVINSWNTMAQHARKAAHSIQEKHVKQGYGHRKLWLLLKDTEGIQVDILAPLQSFDILALYNFDHNYYYYSKTAATVVLKRCETLCMYV